MTKAGSRKTCISLAYKAIARGRILLSLSLDAVYVTRRVSRHEYCLNNNKGGRGGGGGGAGYDDKHSRVTTSIRLGEQPREMDHLVRWRA